MFFEFLSLLLFSVSSADSDSVKQCDRDISEERPIAKTKYGTLKGTYLKAFNNRTYSSFGSIPFADPPVGEFRFEVARQLTPWEGIRNASELAPYCLQGQGLSQEPFMGQEDCLFLNIYTPKLNLGKMSMDEDDCDNCPISGCPIIVYIHGGAFEFGASQDYGGKYLMQSGEIILVTINYRVGPLGFLSTEDQVLPGNVGLKDQVKALEFIQENIHSFGGNPQSVTITGMSAGGASVHFMYLSPLTRDLFHRGYSMSGSTFCPWPIQEAAREKAQRLAATLGCPTDSTRELVDCLKTKPGNDIVVLTPMFQPFHGNPFTVFGPVVEVPNDTAFLTKNPYELIKSREFHDKPLILSLNGKEGLFPAGSYIANETVMADINNRWNKIAPFLLDYNYTVAPENQDEVSQKIRRFYYGDGEISVENYEPLLEMVGDRLFSVAVSRAALLQASRSISPVYTYVFYYRGEESFSEILSQRQNNYGASHADDTAYAVSVGYIIPGNTESDRAMMSRFVNMWTTYATTGKPSFGGDVNWPSISRFGQLIGRINYLEIHSPIDFRHNSSYNFAHHNFWDRLPINEPTAGQFTN